MPSLTLTVSFSGTKALLLAYGVPRWKSIKGYDRNPVRLAWQVTTLLSKAEQAEAQQKVTPDALAALEAKVSEQGKAVAEVKAVRLALCFGAAPCRLFFGSGSVGILTCIVPDCTDWPCMRDGAGILSSAQAASAGVHHGANVTWCCTWHCTGWLLCV